MGDREASTNGAQSGAYHIQEQWHSQAGPVKVIAVGAGAAGLLVAYKMKKMFSNYELTCYEKNPEVAGTWYENRYPGCACDVPAHAYTYSFEANPNWSTFYAYAPEIKQYFVDFSKTHELMHFIKLSHKVQSAVYDEERGIWNVEVERSGQTIKDWCHVFINGTGFLNSWKWPKIPGLQSFSGTLMHSAAWDPSVDWAGKTVAVIGTGSSAIQIVPQIQKKAQHLTAFMRSVTWISPPIGDSVLEAAKSNDPSHAKSEDGILAPTQNKQYYFSDAEKKRFAEDSEYLLAYRQNLESAVNGLFDMFIAGSDTSKAARELMHAEMLRRIGPGHDELKAKLVPSWAPGCRRITPGDGYLEALVQPNVTTVHAEIEKIVPEGLVDSDGKLHKVDILVCATGFNIAFAPPFEVKGRGGVSMRDEFEPEPNVYLAVAVPKFPNYFVVNGVRGNWASGTSLPSNEVQIEYILKCMKRMQTQGIKSMEVKMEPVRQLYEHIDEWHKRSVWNDDCKSWYKNNIVGGKLWIWSGSNLHYMKTLKEGPAWEDYEIKYKNKNKWAYLGNGKVEAEVLHDAKRLAPYMRTADYEWHID